MQEELISIDKLEDQIIDHPDASTKQELDENSLDETFQKKLNARAEQIANQSLSPDEIDLNGDSRLSTDNFQFLVDKNELEYEHEDYGPLCKELNEWFVYNDFKILGGLENLPGKYEESMEAYIKNIADKEFHDTETEYLQHVVAEINAMETVGQSCDGLDSLVYYIFGKYSQHHTESEQINSIRHNVRVIYSLGVLPRVLKLVISFINDRISEDNGTQDPQQVSADEANNFFKLITIFYFIINTYIQCNDSPEYMTIRNDLSEIDVLSSIVTFIEHWKVNPNSNYRIRYLILILWKLILLEFGDSKLLDSCKAFLIRHHNIQPKNRDDGKVKLTCSPLDYFTFREDLLDKYPLYEGNSNGTAKKDIHDFKQFKKTLDEAGNKRASTECGSNISTSSSSSSLQDDYKYFMAMNSHSNTLSNYMANPRPNKAHTIQSQLPAPTVHISTPVPSPPSTPSDFMTGGEKIRKSYQVNQSVPFIYPKTEQIEVPYAIKEADEILQNSVYDSYSNKQLWEERQKFMIQERGFLNQYDHNEDPSHHEFDYEQEKLLKMYPNEGLKIKSIMRVEQFYSKNVDKLTNLVKVFVGILTSNKIEPNLNYIEKELNGQTVYYDNDENLIDTDRKRQIDKILIQQLEVLSVKEITLKASTNIIMLLLRWFKVNHVLKYYYLSTILFDESIFEVVMDYLSNSFNNPMIQETKKGRDQVSYQNRLMNPKIELPNLQFFNNCLRKNVKIQQYELINKKKLNEFDVKYNSSDNFNHVIINKYNENFLVIMINLISIINKVLIKNYTQRILTLNELKPSEMFKMLVLDFYNKHLTTPILKILKKLTPYQGRKWKSMNMDLISMIYLNCRLSIKDNWLSGKDLESDFNNSFDQEISLRGLLQFYNMRKYPDCMTALGYEVSKDFSSFPLDEDFDYL